MSSHRRPHRPSMTAPAPATDATADAKVPSNTANQAVPAKGRTPYQQPAIRWPGYYKSKAYLYRRRRADGST